MEVPSCSTLLNLAQPRSHRRNAPKQSIEVLAAMCSISSMIEGSVRYIRHGTSTENCSFSLKIRPWRLGNENVYRLIVAERMVI